MTSTSTVGRDLRERRSAQRFPVVPWLGRGRIPLFSDPSGSLTALTLAPRPAPPRLSGRDRRACLAAIGV